MTTTESVGIGNQHEFQYRGDEGAVIGGDNNVTAGDSLRSEWFDDCLSVVPKAGDKQESPGGDQPKPAQIDLDAILMRAQPRAVGTEVGAPGAPTPALITKEIEALAYKTLRDNHGKLKYTVDGKEPDVVAPQAKMVLKEEKTPMQIAKDVLGKNANEDQLKLFASMLIKLNGLKGGAEDKIAKDTELKVPGQRKDGGLYFGTPPQIDWHDKSSLTYNPDGSMTAKYTNATGWQVTAVIDLARPWRSTLTTEKDEVRYVAEGTGRKIRFDKKTKDKDKNDWEKSQVQYQDEFGQSVTEFYKAGQKEAYKIIQIDNKAKTKIEATLGSDGEYHGTKKDFTDKVLDADVGITLRGSVYSRSFEVDKDTKERLLIKKFGDTSLIFREKDDKLLRTESKDDFERKVVKTYDEQGEVKTVEITPTAGPKIKLEAKNSGDAPTGDWIGPDGKTKIGTITLGPDDELRYTNGKDRSRVEKPNGDVEETTIKDGIRKVVRSNDKDIVTTEYDAFDFTVKKETYKYENGRTIERTDFKNRRPGTIKIVDDDKSEINLKFDEKQGIYKGVRKDKDGKEVEDVTFNGEKMIFKNRATGKYRAEMHYPLQVGAFVPPAYVEGTYDHNLGLFTRTRGTKTSYSALAPGRTDTFDTDDKNMTGRTSTGRDSAVLEDGSAWVRYRDGSGIQLLKDGKTLRICTGGFDNTITMSELSKEGIEYLKEHKDIDKRDLIEIHRRYADKPEMLKKIYAELLTIDKAKNLSDAEKSDLRTNLMRHLAFPPEIAQVGSPTCAVTVVQRNMCINQPDAYIRHVVRAVSEGKVKVAGMAKEVDVDPAKIKMLDSSGRDLATRIFQNSALTALYHPRMEFVPTEDGVGRMYKLPRVKDDKPVSFSGLPMHAIAEMEYRVTGVDKTVVKVNSVDDLIAVFKKNGGRPMTVGVNANKPPFSTGEDTGDGGHVVTILGITDTKPPRILFANQWGLSGDHSEFHRSVDATVFVENLKSEPSIRVDGRTIGVGLVVVDGDRKKAYVMVDGVMTEDKLATEALAKIRKNEFGD